MAGRGIYFITIIEIIHNGFSSATPALAKPEASG